MALIETVRAALMVESSAGINAEIAALISAAKRELETAGAVSDSSDALYGQAIIFYCKANFGMDNPDSDRYAERFEKLKQILSVDEATRGQWGANA